MKKLIINGIFLLVAVFSGVLLFVLKYQVKEQETVLNRIHRQILRDKREIHMLEAEWAHLNDPQRLQDLVATQTDWQTIQSRQIIKLTDIPMRTVQSKANFENKIWVPDEKGKGSISKEKENANMADWNKKGTHS